MSVTGGTTVLAGAVAVATACAVGVAAAVAVSRRHPQHLVDRETSVPHGTNRLDDTPSTLHHDRHFGRCVVDEATIDAFAELGVLPRVHEEGVPADVHGLGRTESPTRTDSDEVEEPQRLVHDPLGEHAIGLIVLHDEVDQHVPSGLADEVFVGQRLATLHFRKCHGHIRDPFTSC